MKVPALAKPTPEAEADAHWTSLDPRVIWRWRASALGGVVLAALAVAFSGRWFPVDAPTAALALVISALGLPAAWVVPSLRHRAWGYRAGERELWVRHGVWLRVTSVVPLDRIQHVDTRQDVLDKWLRLARVAVFTAGVRGAEILIPGLPAQEAGSLRDRILARRGAVDVV